MPHAPSRAAGSCNQHLLPFPPFSAIGGSRNRTDSRRAEKQTGKNRPIIAVQLAHDVSLLWTFECFDIVTT